MLSDKGTGSSKYINGRKEKDMTNLQELNKQFDALGMTNIRAAVITRGENKGKFAIIQIVPNGQPKEMYMSNKLDSCIAYVQEKFKIPSKLNQKDIKDTRTANLWIKQNGFGNMIKVASELKGNRRIYSVYSLDPRVKNKELYKGSLKQCVDFIKSQTGIKENIMFTDLKSNMRKVGDRQPMQTQKFTGNTQVKQPVQTQNKVSMIRNVDDANRWLQSIGASNILEFKIDIPDSNKKGGTIYEIRNSTQFGIFRSRSIYVSVLIMARYLRKPIPPCINDRGEKVVDIPSANKWFKKYIPEIKAFFAYEVINGKEKFHYINIEKFNESGEIYIETRNSLEDIIAFMDDMYGEPMPYMSWMDNYDGSYWRGSARGMFG